MSNKKVVLTPIAMRRPTDDFINTPSKYRRSIEVEDGEAIRTQDIAVSFAPDGVSDPVMTPAYILKGKNLQGRFIKS